MIAQVLAEVVEDLGSDEERRQQFVATARWVLREMGWEKAAGKLPSRTCGHHAAQISSEGRSP
ncbi:hypothetical protein SF12_01430 [Streptomyces sp. MBRL 601]|nr:hypothetical protein SF12_01430 [Streptomyces sp. MBRL 601]